MGKVLSVLFIGDKTKAKWLKSLIKTSVYQGSKLFNVCSVENAPHRHFDLVITTLDEGISTLTALFDVYEKIPILYFGKDEKLAEAAIQKGIQDVLFESELTPQLLTRIFRYSMTREGIKNGLKERSFTDDLTGVYNRRGFLRLAEQQISLCKRTGRGFLFFLFDLDLLKQVNDSYGHRSGDLALMDVANSLVSAFRSHDLVGRIGGDEFAVIAIDSPPEAEEQLKHHVYRLLGKIKRPFKLSVSVGVIYYGGEEVDILKVIELADTNLYRHKKRRHAMLLGRDERI